MSETSRDLYLEERRQQILRQLDQSGRVSVAELSQQFGVSEVTSRADLQALAGDDLIVRTRGGAIQPRRGAPELPLAARRQQQVIEKGLIGAIAASLVAHGDAIFLDSSSTALAIAQSLKEHRYLTVVTNSLTVAQELLGARGVSVVMLGGTLRRDTASLVGADGLEALRKFNIQKGFFGAHGISVQEGLTDVSADEAAIKRLLVAMCGHVVAVVDATKWGRVGLASFAALDQIHTVITDSHAPIHLVAQVTARGIQVTQIQI